MYDGTRVRGVGIVDEEGTPQTLQADLVVDCTGRGSNAHRWLRDIGFEPPEVVEVPCGVRYATTTLRRRPSDMDATFAVTIESPPDGKKLAAFVMPIEGDRWIVTIVSSFGAEAPTDDESFRRTRRHCRRPRSHRCSSARSSSTPIVTHRLPSSKRRRYEHTTRPRRFPRGGRLDLQLQPGLRARHEQRGDASGRPERVPRVSTATTHGCRTSSTTAPRRSSRRRGRSRSERSCVPGEHGAPAAGTDLVNRYMKRVLLATHVSPEVNTEMILVQNPDRRLAAHVRPSDRCAKVSAAVARSRKAGDPAAAVGDPRRVEATVGAARSPPALPRRAPNIYRGIARDDTVRRDSHPAEGAADRVGLRSPNDPRPRSGAAPARRRSPRTSPRGGSHRARFLATGSRRTAADLFLKLVQARGQPRASIDIHAHEAEASPLPSHPFPSAHVPLSSIDAVRFGSRSRSSSIHQHHAHVAMARGRSRARAVARTVDLSDALNAVAAHVETAGELFGPTLMQWRDLAADERQLARVPAPWRDRVDELVELERQWPAAGTGDSLLHLDVRADNVLLTATRVHFVDWPWASVGARWLDLVAMLPSVAMQGGPDPESLWRAHPWSRGVDDDAVDAFVAGTRACSHRTR